MRLCQGIQSAKWEKKTKKFKNTDDKQQQKLRK